MWKAPVTHVLSTIPLCSISVSAQFHWIIKCKFTQHLFVKGTENDCRVSSSYHPIYIFIHTYSQRTQLCNFTYGISKLKYWLHDRNIPPSMKSYSATTLYAEVAFLMRTMLNTLLELQYILFHISACQSTVPMNVAAVWSFLHAVRNKLDLFWRI